MQDAARAGHVRFTSHAFDELDLESLTPDDAVNCILTGDIINDQYDLRWQQIKYVLWGARSRATKWAWWPVGTMPTTCL
jgi:hypothetical protein